MSKRQRLGPRAMMPYKTCCTQGRCLMPVGAAAGSLDGHDSPQLPVHLASEDFIFSCAHFVAFRGFRERLHGHNYTLEAWLDNFEGGGNSDLAVTDIAHVLRKLCGELNEHFLVPARSDVLKLHIADAEGQLHITCEDGTLLEVPLADCILLPVAHSTAEEIAEYLHGRLVLELGQASLAERSIRWIDVQIKENPTQGAVFGKSVQGASLRSAAKL
eukprot:CAMPEP_0172736470 /NCGR_PEP_ID=MMETSP1074-20121228/115150_1 /TAXON_ID=2916 /ORGANISM="Ceratium fusus, Strain PA161109" /LENGTH=215 /DNA_ID=CAMNT_0013565679 /DNA_START=22 /DNA_END=669 /DNA_ORIENTATION=+